MGLDMYLYKDYYIGGRLAENKDDVIEFDSKLIYKDSKKHHSFKLGVIFSIRCLAAEWRKAYAIDDWFFDKYGNGEWSFYVPQEAIPELYDIVCQILADHSKAQELLPYDTDDEDWYWDDLEETKEQLCGICQEIRDGENYDFWYVHCA